MKQILKYCTFLLVLLSFSCEEVIQVDLEESEPRLVIEASLLWFKGTPGTQQEIRISRTTAFYNEENEIVETAEVKVISENEEVYNFTHQENGIYINNNFKPELNLRYNLQVIHEEQLYTASEKLIPVSSIDSVEQTAGGGFSGNDIEIKAYYSDPEDEENYYLFKFRDENVSLELYEDEFTNGNQIFGYYSNEDIEQGDLIQIEIQGISKSYYEYLFILRSQIGSNDGGPFETMPATVKGNIINTDDQNKYPFGYFRLSQVDSTSFTIN
jgi:hypothetical protein